MKNILDFQKFEESYLKGSRQPMYHFTYSINPIIASDEFRMRNTAARKALGREWSNSWTRNIDFSDASGCYIIEVDSDKLKNDGIIFYPVLLDAVTTPNHNFPILNLVRGELNMDWIYPKNLLWRPNLKRGHIKTLKIWESISYP